MSEYETLKLLGTLEGHSGWVTSLAVSHDNPDILISGSRDKTVIAWRLTPEKEEVGFAHRSFHGHNHVVQDVTVSADSEYILSASWDRSLRLWGLKDDTCVRFTGHTGDVMSCAISADNRIIASASRDGTAKFWSVFGEEVLSLDAHNDWATSVKFTPEESPKLVTAGHDKLVKVWDGVSNQLIAEFVGHKNYITSAVLSPDGTLCASGGKEGTINIWSIENLAFSHALKNSDEVFALAFAPTRYWIAAATAGGVKIFDLTSETPREILLLDDVEGKQPTPISLAWSADGQVLFVGYTDHAIRAWQVMTAQAATIAA